MKKTIISLFLGLAVAITCFFMGWAQCGLPIGAVGVLRSNTHGTDGGVILPGKIRWVWYKVIPKNAVVSAFFLNEAQIPLEISGTLPSGAVYSALAGLKTDFSYSFSGALTYKLKAHSLPTLAEKENLMEQADLDRYLLQLNGKIQTHVRRLLMEYAENEKALKEAHDTGTIRGLELELRGAFPNIELRSCAFTAVRFPDLILYDEIRRLYRDYLAAQRREVRDDIVTIAAENIKNMRRFDELAAYGDLLTKYPVLIQYLALEKGFPP
jgi:hypothetical protein